MWVRAAARDALLEEIMTTINTRSIAIQRANSGTSSVASDTDDDDEDGGSVALSVEPPRRLNNNARRLSKRRLNNRNVRRTASIDYGRAAVGAGGSDSELDEDFEQAFNEQDLTLQDLEVCCATDDVWLLVALCCHGSVVMSTADTSAHSNPYSS